MKRVTLPPSWGPLLLVVLFAFLLRAGYGLTRPSVNLPWPDEDVYFAIAGDLAYRNVYTYPPGGPPLVTQYPPVWPFLLAGGLRAGLSVGELRLVVALLSTLGVLGVALAAREAARAVDPRRAASAGVVAGLLAAVAPYSIFYAGTFLLETPFVALLAWLLWSALRLIAAPSPDRGATLGAVLGAATLAKSSLYPLAALILLAVPLLALARRIPPAAAGALLGATLLVWAPWLVRNHGLTGSWVFTAQGGYVLYEANHPGADGGPRHLGETWDIETRTRDLPEFEKSRAFRAAAISWIRENPVDFLRLAAKKIRRLWNPVPNFAEFAASRFNWWVSLAWNAPLFLLALGGAWRHRGAIARLWPLAVFPLYVTAVHAVFVSSVRYREPAVPSLLVLATLALLPYLRPE